MSEKYIYVRRNPVCRYMYVPVHTLIIKHIVNIHNVLCAPVGCQYLSNNGKYTHKIRYEPVYTCPCPNQFLNTHLRIVS